MSIQYIEQKRVFQLNTKSSTYLMAVVDEEQFLGHVYYGARIMDEDMNYLMRIFEPPYVPSINNRDRVSFYDSFPMEYPTYGVGDYRESCLEVKDSKGHRGCCLHYHSHRIYQGKEKLEGMPATFGQKEDCSTIEITCIDPILHLHVILVYSVYEEIDVITRSVRIENHGQAELVLEKVLSVCIDFDGIEYDMLSLHGSWARERHVQRRKIQYGIQSISSYRGESSHQENPFMAILSKDATEDYGEVYGFHFVYSGNFIGIAQGCQFDTVRGIMGIHPTGFQWLLEPNQSFVAPEVAMVYSNQGIGGMTRTYHDLYRNYLIRGEYRDKKRPILINNWEATYFDFNTEKLLSIAKEASALGIEMLVMDDGWFGKRNSDNEALGDWTVNEEKIVGGLNHLVTEVNKLGMKFGIWFEPEMISPDSDLYRAHPDWAIQIPDRAGSLCRNQYVLDLSRAEIRDYIFESIAKVLHSASIEYVKWDMNRQLTDLGSYALTSERQGELFHRYTLGVYELMERFTQEFPHILLENCSGGGARFDPGMLYYSPQIWCSDDTDAIERLEIQRGTALVYPLSSIGAHVSDVPNHTVGRKTPFETRGYVALAGTFGYELDVTKLSKEDKEQIPVQVEMYHKYNDLIRNGDYYRIAAGIENGYDCWQVVSKDKSETIVTFIQVLQRANVHSRRICLKGLEEETIYQTEDGEMILSGGALMSAGILITEVYGDFQGKIYYFQKKRG